MKSNKKFIISGILVILILSVLITIGINKRAEGTNRYYYDSVIIPTDYGTAYIPPLFTGNTIPMEGSVFNAVPTPDQKRIVVLEEDGNLYVTDLNLTEKIEVADNGNSILEVCNEGVLYRDSRHICYRYLFGDGSTLSLGKINDYLVSQEEFTIAFADRKKRVYVLPANSTEKEEIGNYSGKIDIVAVANGGNTVVYGNIVKDRESVMLYSDGRLEQLYTLPKWNTTLSSVVVSTFESEDGTSFVINSPTLDTTGTVYIKYAGKKTKSIANPNLFFAIPLSCSSDRFYLHSSYYQSLHWYSPGNNEFQTVSYGIASPQIYEEQIYYLNIEKNLQCADIQNGKLSRIKNLDNQVSSFHCTPMERNIFYTKEQDLYVFERGLSPKLIASAIDTEAGYFLGTDEKSVYYFTQSGALMRYVLGEDSTEIDTQVVPESITSNRKDGYINGNSFIYKRVLSSENEEKKLKQYEWKYYDGKQSSAFTQATQDVTEWFEENPYVPAWRR